MINKIHALVTDLDAKNWYRFLIGFAVALVVILGLYLFFYYRWTNQLYNRIEQINSQREEVKTILTKSNRVRKERREITTMLEEDPDFKIKGYLQEVLAQLSLAQLVTTESDTSVDRDDDYRESLVTYQFSGMNMKQLTQLLNDVEQNKRLFIKELDISKSRKLPRAIDVGITIATIQPKVS